jgi:hypothetical protein
MGTGKRSLRDLLRKADAGEVHLRTHETTGIGWDGHGREHPADLPTLRDEQNEGGPQPSSESKKTKIIITRIEEIQDTTTIWEGKPMEKKDGRHGSAPLYNWRGFLESASKSMETAAAKDGDPLLNAHRVAKIMASLYDISIHPTDVARVLHCQAIMLASQDGTNAEKHRHVITTAAALAELSRPQGDPEFDQLRVATEMANQLAGLPSA